MKVTTLGALISAAVIAACFVDRPSKDFECDSNADCLSIGDDRVCKSGYCVVPNCPGDCPTCDEDQRICPVECTSADSCGSVTCPSGWTCTINCVGANACSNVFCQAGSTCTVTCTGTDACEDVDCDAACACDLDCAAGACNTPDCPAVGNGANAVQCTVDGTDGANCDSSRASGCVKC